jgi:translation elongation factor EF-Ts
MSTETAVKIDAKLVKELREKSGAPMGDCLKALQEAKGNMEDAFVVLRKRGMASAAKVAQADLDREKEVFLAQPAMKGKPEGVIEKILQGKMDKFYEEVCLLDQPFIKEASQTIQQLIASKIAKLGENISVRRFARFKVGANDWTVAQTKPAADEASA